MNIGDRIRLRRNQLDKTLEDVGKVVGVTRATIQRYENGNIQNIPSDKIELLAKALKTTPAYLMGWEDDETIKQNVQERKIIESFNKLNDKGKEKAIAYTQDLVDSGKYKKTIKEDTSDYITTIDDMRSYLMTIPMAAFDGKLNPAQMDDEEIQSLYKLLKDND